MEDAPFLGTGWSFPPRFPRARGEVEMVSGEHDVIESLRVLFATAPGERLMQPAFGVSPRELIFEPASTGMRTLLADRIRDALLIHEPRIRVLDLRVAMAAEPGSGTLAIELDFEVRATNTRFNLVFPYYRSDGNELRARLGA
jgi:hypothetical protein